MRMSSAGPSAADAVNGLELDELTAIFRVYGEERKARRAAQAIIWARETAPITTTLELADIVGRAVGGKPGRIHPATRSFQALRIYVNDELGELVRGLAAGEHSLKAAGRLVTVTFHSLEDRIVKNFLRERAGLVPGGSRHQPERVAAQPPSFSVLSRKAIAASDAECADNPRARSAKLRAAVRTADPAFDHPDSAIKGAPPYQRLLEVAS
jgi:16S rRNA (cytosine1402-N4)-methyltransferase